ncbi:hypothetical protein RKE25_11425 [Dyella sp. BiH032]|uniref:hypothetical protein n=1 Tax=Dyella sp. BiH032 TaxID=3075430 RepID=UPI0028935C00|nr:hypothetical protein [Dyella sp. BiH032]WNL44040.1 hypothetical protein RKE25_11425 [Dyella sp. BiH032]
MFRKPSADAGIRPAAPARRPGPKSSQTVDGWISLARFMRRYDRVLGRAPRNVRGKRVRGRIGSA